MNLDTLIIPILLLLPLLGGTLILLVPKDKVRLICYLAVFVTVVEFVLSLVAAGIFDWGQSEAIQLVHVWDWVPRFGLRLAGGVDALSLWFVLLTTFLMPLVMLESMTQVVERTGDRIREYFFWLLFAETAMIGAFTATDLIYFYVCFEVTLVPLFFLIGLFGSSNRLKAAATYFFYSFTGSMLMLAGILYVAWFNATLNVQDLIHTGALAAADLQTHPQLGQWTFDFNHLMKAAGQMDLTQQGWVLAALLCGFGVKVPMWPVHTWLPLAHTEAPTAGSVDLAAVLLKLGTYGILRFALQTCPDAVVAFAPAIAVLAIIGILYAALVCWVQTDIKKLIAYSSVSHMGFCILGLFAINSLAVGGSVYYMLSHGLSTGALFLTVGMMYNRYHTRDMRELGGLARVLPVWSFFMVFFCLASVGLPGLNGFVGEFLVLMGTFEATGLLGWPYALAAGAGMILAAVYILYMVGCVIFGPVKTPAAHGPPVKDLNAREITALVPLAILCLVLGIYPKPILTTVEASIKPMIAPAQASLARQTAPGNLPRATGPKHAATPGNLPHATGPKHAASPGSFPHATLTHD